MSAKLGTTGICEEETTMGYGRELQVTPGCGKDTLG